MNISASVIVVAAAVAVVVALGIAFEWLCRRAEAAIERELVPYLAYEARHPRLNPDDDWDQWMAELRDERLERLPASTGELRRLYERDYPGWGGTMALSDTGELRRLAEAGDLDALREINAAWEADNLTEEEA